MLAHRKMEIQSDLYRDIQNYTEMMQSTTKVVSNKNDTWFWESFPEKPPVWADLFEVIPSRAAFEQFTSAIGLGELLEKP